MANGTVHVYALADGSKRYRVAYRDADHVQHTKRGFKRKRDADEYLARVTVARSDGTWTDPRDALALTSELGEEWLAHKASTLKPSTYRALESSWRVHVSPAWADVQVGKISHSRVQAWVSKLSVDLSATSVLRAHGILSSILDTAVRDRRIPANPARGVTLPRKSGKARAYLSHEQVQLLADSSPYPDLVLFLAYTGLRWGEATGLRVKHVDALRRRVTVEENAVMVGGHIEVGTPKTHERRSVPFPVFLSLAIARACEGKGHDAILFGDGSTWMRIPNSARGWFTFAVQRAQAADPTFPRVTPHDLRHTAASLAISAGANVKAVQRMLGHASAAMTLDTYADLFDDDLDAVAAALHDARSERIGAASLA
ncbi:site-specific integrase [Microbacterium indicum]|uniref:site-specific integrase n=1 Tax=Microbacterium indicum TaxID=358100 RepID=UPI00048A470F|nr:site-specific integrase [Microbacterium indicum]